VCCESVCVNADVSACSTCPTCIDVVLCCGMVVFIVYATVTAALGTA